MANISADQKCQTSSLAFLQHKLTHFHWLIYNLIYTIPHSLPLLLMYLNNSNVSPFNKFI